MAWTLRPTRPDRQRSRDSTSPLVTKPQRFLHKDLAAPREADNHGQLPDRNHPENNRSRTIRPPRPLPCMQPSQGSNPHPTNLSRLQSRTSSLQNPITPKNDGGRQTPRTTSRSAGHAPAREHAQTLLVHSTPILNQPGPYMALSQDAPLRNGRGRSGNYRGLRLETMADHPNEPGSRRAKTKSHPGASLSGPRSTSFTDSPSTPMHGDTNVNRPTSK
jgi:hypothetical protein